MVLCSRAEGLWALGPECRATGGGGGDGRGGYDSSGIRTRAMDSALRFRAARSSSS